MRLTMLVLLIVISIQAGGQIKTQKAQIQKKGTVQEKAPVQEKPPIAKLKENQHTYFFEKKYLIFTSIQDGKLIYSEDCKGKKCEAVKAAEKKLPFPSVKMPGMYNPGAAYCADHSGKPVIALDKAGDSYDFCRFKDGSLVDSWTMLFNHYPKKVIK